jgi:acetylornithine deacetylase/succinyl-diaminopimelate desuccinylase-like protein
MLEGGHAVNALPQTSRAVVQCRMMPTEKVDDVKAALMRVLADDQITVTPVGLQCGQRPSECPTVASPVLSQPSALDEQLLSTIEKTSAEFWPGVLVVPLMAVGTSDGSYLRNAGIPTYGHSGRAQDVDDLRAHGKDERVAVKAFFEGGEYLYRLVKRLSGGK